MPEKISSFVDRFWPWIVSVLTVGVGAGTAKAKLVTKKEIYGDGGVPKYMTRNECGKAVSTCHKDLKKTFEKFEKKIDNNQSLLMAKIDKNQEVMTQTLIDFAGKIGK